MSTYRIEICRELNEAGECTKWEVSTVKASGFPGFRSAEGLSLEAATARSEELNSWGELTRVVAEDGGK